MKKSPAGKSNLSIILFLCNWGPHAAYQILQDAAAQIPVEIKMVRIPCTGRISKALLFKPFEMGADGVGLVGCEPGTCRYGAGTETSQRNVEDTRGFLELLGLGKDRLRLATFMPEESGALYQFLESFTGAIKNIGVGCASKRGKFNLHLGGHPKYGLCTRHWMPERCMKEECPDYEVCINLCAVGAIEHTKDSVEFHRDKCIGCMACIGVVT